MVEAEARHLVRLCRCSQLERARLEVPKLDLGLACDRVPEVGKIGNAALLRRARMRREAIRGPGADESIHIPLLDRG